MSLESLSNTLLDAAKISIFFIFRHKVPFVVTCHNLSHILVNYNDLNLSYHTHYEAHSTGHLRQRVVMSAHITEIEAS